MPLGEISIGSRSSLNPNARTTTWYLPLVRLNWNLPEKNIHGDCAEVRIQRGSSSYADLADGMPSVVKNGPELQPLDFPAIAGHEREIDELLRRARKYWDEYQKLKSAKRRA